MDFDWHTLRCEFPVFLWNHLSIHLLVTVKKLIQIDFGIPRLKFFLLLTVSLLLLMDLHQGLFDKFSIRLDELHHLLESISDDSLHLRVLVLDTRVKSIIGL